MHIEFPESLPVSARREEIAAAIRDHPVVIVCGETGSGKTTQLPKIALALGRGQSGRSIGHTQPRRLAAVTVARRIAEELGTPCGNEPQAAVGYQIRFNDRSRPGIPVKLMTDGVLLAQTQHDPFLKAYDTLIIDEAHERSLNIDFLSGYLKNLLPRRPDLRVVITSATIDAQRFAQHFGQPGRPAPVIEVSGRMYPVEVRWRAPLSTDQDLIESVVAGIEECERDWSGQGPGDILVFLPGEREIKAVADELRARSSQSMLARSGKMAAEVLPLFARLSQADQDRVFRRSGRRRVVLSTNVAETSLTVPDIRYVVDSGLARVKRYRYRAKVEQLQIEPIAQAQANQRMGRCGRVADGVCIRLYDEADFASRPAFADPEIHRSALAAVLLRMKALGLPDVRDFPFIDPPSGKAVADGLTVLRELRALDESGNLTAIGQALSRLPMDPRIGRMLVAARDLGALAELLVIGGFLSIQDPRERPEAFSGAADRMHARFAEPTSEFLSVLKLWAHVSAMWDNKESNRKFDQALRAEYLSPMRVREWRDVVAQLGEWTSALGFRANEQPAAAHTVHQAILAGLLSNVGCRAPDEPIWHGCHDVKFLIWPGSLLAKKPPRWLMAAEQVETSRLFARMIAVIEPEWLETIGAHLLKTSVSDPHWEKKSGRVVGFQRATLYGLTVYQRRRVAWAGQGPRQLQEAREIFIRQALVEGDWDCRLRFFIENKKRIKEVEALEHKARRPDILIDDELLFAFYDRCLPADVADADGLTRWYRAASQSNPDLLCLAKEDLMRHEAAGITSDQFPKVLSVRQGGQVLAFALEYHFDPGGARDGVTLLVTPDRLSDLQPQAMDWLVPGMLKEKVIALLKTLPQKLRRHCVPLPEYAAGFCARWHEQRGTMPLVQALIQDIVQQTGVAPRRDDFKLDGLSPHCRMNVRVLDPHGRMLAEGRDLVSLQSALGVSNEQALAAKGLPTREQWRDRFAHAAKEPLKALEKEVHGRRELGMVLTAMGSLDTFVRDLRALTMERVFLADGLPDSEDEFSARWERGRSRVLLVGQEILRLSAAVVAEHSAVAKKLPTLRGFPSALADIEQQLTRLVPKDFLLATPFERLTHLPRYLKAISARMDKCRADPARDTVWAREVATVEQPFWRWASQNRGGWSDAATEFRWMCEELRVATFAQELKTPLPMSVKRLQKAWVNLQNDA